MFTDLPADPQKSCTATTKNDVMCNLKEVWQQLSNYLTVYAACEN